jgi:hypothetical protein
MKIEITDFCKRQFERNASGTKIPTPIDEFQTRINQKTDEIEYLLNKMESEKTTSYESPMIRVMEGYKPFCKLVAIENFTKARVGTMQITNENYQYLRSGYSGRRDFELPVLSRWFELPLSPPKAKYLILILYSREQLLFEHNGNPETVGTPFELEGEWGIVSILGQKYNKEEPMTPITSMRNALDISEGGSGAPLDKDYYERAVGFWSNHAIVKQR